MDSANNEQRADSGRSPDHQAIVRFSSTTVNRTQNNQALRTLLRAPATPTTKATIPVPVSSSSSSPTIETSNNYPRQTKFGIIHPNNNASAAYNKANLNNQGSQTVIRPLRQIKLGGTTNQANTLSALATATKPTATTTSSSTSPPKAFPRTSQIGAVTAPPSQPAAAAASSSSSPSSGISRSPQSQHQLGGTVTVGRHLGQVRPTLVRTGQLLATSGRPTTAVELAQTGSTTISSPLQQTAPTALPATASKLVSSISSFGRPRGAGGSSKTTTTTTTAAAATQAQLKPAVSASRLPTSTSAAFSLGAGAAAATHHLSKAAVAHGGASVYGGREIKAIPTRPAAISSATITRPSTTLAQSTGPSTGASSRLLVLQQQQQQQQRTREALKSVQQQRQQQQQQHSDTIIREGDNGQFVVTSSSCSNSSTSNAPTLFQLISDTNNIDISSVQNDVSLIRQTLEQLVVVLKSAQNDRDKIEKENEKLRNEVVELRSKLDTFKLASENNANRNQRELDNYSELEQLKFNSNEAANVQLMNSGNSNYNNIDSIQQRKTETFFIEQRQRDETFSTAAAAPVAIVGQQQQHHTRPSVYYSPMN